MSALWIPADRFLNVARHYIEPLNALSSSTERQLNKLRSGEQQYVSLWTADRMLVEMGLDHFLRIPAPDGLADIYEGGKQYGSPRPDMARIECPKCLKTRWVSAKNARVAERRRCNACARNERPAKIKSRLERVPVRCGVCGAERLVQAWYASEAATRACTRCSNTGRRVSWFTEETGRVAGQLPRGEAAQKEAA